MRLVPEVVVPDQAVEIKRRCRADVGLIIADFRHRADVPSQRLGDAGGFFKRSALRHVDHQLNLALIIEGQHLHDDVTRVKQ